MKKLLIILVLLFITVTSKGQSYQFETRIEEYQNLINPISLNQGEVWEMADYTIPIGFNFPFYDVFIDTLYFFDSAPSILSSSDKEWGMHQILIPFGASLVDRGYPLTISQSPLSYELSGVIGNRVLKIEWQNVGFMMEFYMNGTLNDYSNFQLWLYETTGKIEIHIGPTQISYPSYAYTYESGPEVSIIPVYDYDMDTISSESFFLIGNPSNPTVIQSNEYYYLDGTIPANKVFIFNNLIVNTKTMDKESISIFPNPAHETIKVRLPQVLSNEVTVQIRSLIGNEVFTACFLNNSNTMTIPVANIPKGMYQVIILNDKMRCGSSFIKL